MTKDEALDKALNALLWANIEINDWRDDAQGYKPEDQPQIMEAINAIKQALAAPVQEPIGYLFQHEETGLTQVVDVQQVEWGFEKNNPRHQKIGPVYTTPPAAPVQDNDAHYKGVVEGVQKLFDDKRAQPAPVQEPVACKTLCELCVKRGYDFCANTAKTTPIPTPPATQRQWVGLTDKEVDAAIKSNWGEMKGGPLVLNRMYVRAIEAKLKERNT
jgi:hypothetical protein